MFVNLTPHAITVVHSVTDHGVVTVTVAPSGKVARCTARSAPAGEHGGVPLVRKTYGEVENLPDPAEGVIYIVSTMVRVAVPHRSDVASPDELVRDPDGRVVGCKNLEVN